MMHTAITSVRTGVEGVGTLTDGDSHWTKVLPPSFFCQSCSAVPFPLSHLTSCLPCEIRKVMTKSRLKTSTLNGKTALLGHLQVHRDLSVAYLWRAINKCLGNNMRGWSVTVLHPSFPFSVHWLAFLKQRKSTILVICSMEQFHSLDCLCRRFFWVVPWGADLQMVTFVTDSHLVVRHFKERDPTPLTVVDSIKEQLRWKEAVEGHLVQTLIQLFYHWKRIWVEDS